VVVVQLAVVQLLHSILPTTQGFPGMAKIRLDIKRLGIGDLTVAGTSVAIMIGVFLPWYEFGDPAVGYYHFSAADLRTWMYVPCFVSLAVVGSVVAKATQRRSRSPLLLAVLVAGACGADLVLTLGCFVKKAPGLRWDYGAYVSVAAASVAAVTAAAVVVGAAVRVHDHGALPLGRRPRITEGGSRVN
jgi:hypothetical protein